MDEILNNLYSSSSTPLWSAILLGLMTAISPCPLATNITAIGFISKDIKEKNRVFFNGLIYTLGRAAGYTTLAAVLYYSADIFQISALFQTYGEWVLGPLLIIIGLSMLDIIKFNFINTGGLSDRIKNKKKRGYWDSFLLGMIFALAFCPYSGVLFFGMLIPLTIETGNLLLPIGFSIATGIPVVIFAWLLAYTVSGVGKLYQGLNLFEKWFRRVISIVFIAIGIYYCIVIWIL